MKYFIFDTETTGLESDDEVVELGGIYLDSEFRLMGGFHKYWLPLKPVTTQSQRVNNLSMADLSRLTDRFIEQDVYEIGQDDTVFVEWSSRGFDRLMVNQSLRLHGYPAIDFGRDVTRVRPALKRQHILLQPIVVNGVLGGKTSRLREVSSTLLSAEEIALAESIVSGMPNGRATYHSAAFDAAITALLLIKFKELIL